MKLFGFRKNPKKYFFEIFRKIFWSRENLFFSRQKYMKIANLLRNPKNTLRKLYDHLKYTKTGKNQLFNKIFPELRMVLRITTLNPLLVADTKVVSTFQVPLSAFFVLRVTNAIFRDD